MAKLPPKRGDPVAREAPVRLDLGLARAPGADAAIDAAGAEALEVGPEAAHPREVVLELRELDLELALGRVRVVGEDVEDHGRAVDHRHVERRLEVRSWRGASSSSHATRFAPDALDRSFSSASLPRPR